MKILWRSLSRDQQLLVGLMVLGLVILDLVTTFALKVDLKALGMTAIGI